MSHSAQKRQAPSQDDARGNRGKEPEDLPPPDFADYHRVWNFLDSPGNMRRADIEGKYVIVSRHGGPNTHLFKIAKEVQKAALRDPLVNVHFGNKRNINFRGNLDEQLRHFFPGLVTPLWAMNAVLSWAIPNSIGQNKKYDPTEVMDFSRKRHEVVANNYKTMTVDEASFLNERCASWTHTFRFPFYGESPPIVKFKVGRPTGPPLPPGADYGIEEFNDWLGAKERENVATTAGLRTVHAYGLIECDTTQRIPEVVITEYGFGAVQDAEWYKETGRGGTLRRVGLNVTDNLGQKWEICVPLLEE
jgi:hypothetical protein